MKAKEAVYTISFFVFLVYTGTVSSIYFYDHKFVLNVFKESRTYENMAAGLIGLAVYFIYQFARKRLQKDK